MICFLRDFHFMISRTNTIKPPIVPMTVHRQIVNQKYSSLILLYQTKENLYNITTLLLYLAVGLHMHNSDFSKVVPTSSPTRGSRNILCKVK